MISKAPDVGIYIEETPAQRRPTMEKLRSLCLEHLRGYEEGIAYGMPVYQRNGVMEISFASQKNYIALYVMKKDVLDEFRGELSGASIGKGCIRFSKPEKIDFEIVARLLRRNAESNAAPC